MGKYTRATAVGKREHRTATGHALKSMAYGAGGLATAIGTAASAYSGDVFGTLVMGSISDHMFDGAAVHARKAVSGNAHSRAVESLIARSRGGSAVLGMHGGVPQAQPRRRFQPPMHLGGPKPSDKPFASGLRRLAPNKFAPWTDMRTGDGVPGPDGISPAARMVGNKPDAMNSAMQDVLRNNPDLRKQIESEAAGGNTFSKSLLDGSFSKGPRDIQDIYDAVHSGTHGRSNGSGQVYKGDARPPGMMKVGGPAAVSPTFSAFNRANGTYRTPAQSPAPSDSTGKRRGWSNQARINSAIARGAQNLPYGGNPDDGTGQ